MKILVVDDDVIVIKSCTRILESRHFTVSTVSGAEEALELLKNHTFDLLLVDLMMPRQDGLSLIKAIRESLPEIPIIAMSGYPTPETIAKVFSTGATQFIHKPFRPDELLILIHQVMGI
jgi:CheY-like chemotaxis protein